MGGQKQAIILVQFLSIVAIPPWLDVAGDQKPLVINSRESAGLFNGFQP